MVTLFILIVLHFLLLLLLFAVCTLKLYNFITVTLKTHV